VLREVDACQGFLSEIRWQTRSGNDCFEIVAYGQGGGAAAGGVELHHPALETLIDHRVIVWVGGGSAGRPTPTFQTVPDGLGWFSSGIACKAPIKFDRHSIPHVRDLSFNEQNRSLNTFALAAGGPGDGESGIFPGHS